MLGSNCWGLYLVTYCHTSSPPQAGGTSSRRRRRLDTNLCDISATDRDSAVQKRSFDDNRRALPSPYETAQSTCPHSPVFAGDDATDKELLEVVQSVLARSDWPSVLFRSPVCTLGFDIRVRRSITGGAGLCSVSTSSHSVVSSWDRCLSVNSLWGVIERCEPRLRPVFSWRSVKRLICYKKRPTPHVSRPGIVTYERNL